MSSRPLTDEERVGRFWAKVAKTETCWLWTGSCTGNGYGRFSDGARTVLAHRWLYERERGAIPALLGLDHLCHVRNCVRPDHLQAVAQRENLARRLKRTWEIPIEERRAARLARFFDRVTKTEGCWLWTGVRSAQGYGLFYQGDRYVTAHRWLYQHEFGPLGNEAVLDHLCRTRQCVRPDHLEPVSTRTNVLRGIGPSAQNAEKSVCKRGHPLSGDNLYLSKNRRHCRTCRAELAQTRRAARKTMPHPRDRTHCPKGHPYAGDNLRIEHKPDGSAVRVCYACKHAKQLRMDARRSKGKGLPGLRTHCPQGHEYTEANTYRPPSGQRHCRTCKAEKQQRRRHEAVKKR